MLSPETSTTRPAAVARLVASLEAAVGRERVLTGADVLAGYTTDWTRRYRGPAACAVRPRDTAEVAAVIRACARCRAVIVPQGGNTSLAGGSVPPPQPDPARPCVILSTGRLTGLGPVDALTGQLTAGAGVTIGALAGQAAAAGFRYGVDLASRDSATVGGTIATNAGGMRTIRYGPTRAQLLGVQVVLADGSVLSRLAGLPAESAGYDLTGLMAGSEGTLGVITAARLRLWPAEERGPVILAGVAGIDEAASLYAQLRDRAGGLRAAEYFEATAADLVSRLTGGRPPGPPRPAYLLAELPAAPGAEDRAAELPGLARAAVAADPAGRDRLFGWRERITEAISAAGIPHKIDVAIPLARLGAFRAGLDSAARDAAGPGALVTVFGHLGAGNLHINILGPDPGDDAVDTAVMRLAAGHGGSISAEHGLGRAKAGHLHLCRSPAEIAAMRAIKHALDPDGMLNPGAVLP
jgi:FAD/FMN-containing dehydrogenase